MDVCWSAGPLHARYPIIQADLHSRETISGGVLNCFSSGPHAHGGLSLPKQEWPAFRHWWVWDAWRRYFRLRVVTPPLPYLDPAKPVLFRALPPRHLPHGQLAQPRASVTPRRPVCAPC